MSNWRDQILREFTPNSARLTLVADPDALLLEEGILSSIHDRGFELIPFEDHIAFRYAYESRFRFRWDQGEQTDLVVLLRSGSEDLATLPYDLFQAGRKLTFTLGEIFPNLSYPIVSVLDRGDLDALYDAQKRHTPGIMGDNATKEFVLRHVFEIVPEIIKKPSDLLRILLRRHYRKQRIPYLLDERFIQVLRQRDTFTDWPLESIIPDGEAFFAFLQERWPVFIERFAVQVSNGFREDRKPYGFEFPGPSDLPFDHDDIRIYIDNLFLEGHLEAVSHEKAESLSKTWLAFGIRTDDRTDKTQRLEGLLNSLANDIPNEDSRHEKWFHFARRWAELVALSLELEGLLSESLQQKVKSLQTRIDDRIVHWLKQRYAGLINLPPVPPVMVHHIPRLLSRYLHETQGNKLAFILIDGLSMDQWVVVRKVLTAQRPEYRIRENAVLAWIPTITSVSRQAAFSGKPPIYFPNSIHTTEKETVLWTQFWVDQGLGSQEIAYARGVSEDSLNRVEEILARPKTKVIGLVVDKVDKIMHGMELGASGMHNQIRQWIKKHFLENLVDLLLENSFKIHITSDHGNIEATGCGRPMEGAIAEIRGERTRIYSDSLLRKQVNNVFPDAVEWPPIGLPEGYLPLLAPDRQAFIRKKERIVCHGGVCLEEIVVPFAQIERKKR